MTTGDKALNELKRLARSRAADVGGVIATEEYVARYVLESFLHRLSKSPFRDSFVIKGGVLLAAYDARRGTRDVDTSAVGTAVTPEYLSKVIQNLAGSEVNDGVEFFVDSIDLEEIQIGEEYPGFRLKFGARVGSAIMHTSWDVTTGSPLVPAPRLVSLPRLLGEPIQLLAYSREAIIAEKGVTILERGITNTRWRDFVDIVRLAESGIESEDLLRSARAVAKYRGVLLESVSGYVSNFPLSSQAKWTAWRKKNNLERVCEVDLQEQMKKVAEILDPVFKFGP